MEAGTKITTRKTKIRRQMGAVEKAYKRKGEAEAIQAVILKTAQMIDDCASARDYKPLVTCMYESIDRLNAVNAAKAATSSGKITPLAEILAAAKARKAAPGGEADAG